MSNNISISLKPGSLNESQAAAYLGVSPSTLAEWRKDGFGPRFCAIVRPGKEKARNLYPLKFLDEWLEKQAIQNN
jgi:hypothetical protein